MMTRRRRSENAGMIGVRVEGKEKGFMWGVRFQEWGSLFCPSKNLTPSFAG